MFKMHTFKTVGIRAQFPLERDANVFYWSQVLKIIYKHPFAVIFKGNTTQKPNFQECPCADGVLAHLTGFPTICAQADPRRSPSQGGGYHTPPIDTLRPFPGPQTSTPHGSLPAG